MAGTAEKKPVSISQALLGTALATSEEQHLNDNATMSEDIVTATVGQNGQSNLNLVPTCSATSLTSSVSDESGVNSEQSNAASNASKQTSRSVIMRPIATASESASKEYVVHIYYLCKKLFTLYTV